MDSDSVGRDSIAEMVRLRKDGMSFAKIGKQFNLTRQRVQQLVSEVIKPKAREPQRKSPRDYPRVLLHVSKEMTPCFAARAGDADDRQVHSGSAYGAIARRDLVRYWGMIDFELSQLEFTEAEGVATCKALNGEHDLDPRFLSTVVDKKALERPRMLIGKLMKLNRCQALAVMDAAERFNVLSSGATAAEKLRKVGLLK